MLIDSHCHLDAPEFDADRATVVVPGGAARPAAGLRERGEPANLRAQGDDVLRECGAALEAQGHVGDPPAVVLGADPVADRDAYLVEEDLAELG